jgi:hypothetical protein
MFGVSADDPSLAAHALPPVGFLDLSILLQHGSFTQAY